MTEEEKKFVDNYLRRQQKASAANVKKAQHLFNPKKSAIFKRDPLKHILSL